MNRLPLGLLICCNSVLAVGQLVSDGNSLQKLCRNGQAPLSSLRTEKDKIDSLADLYLCGGYIQGVVDTIEDWRILDEKHQKDKTPDDVLHPCIPESVSESQIQKVVEKYLEDHPEKLHFRASVLVLVALQKAFPCR
jgi:Rap1a immunity proteins